jgi:hypothetical protein
MFWSVLRHGKSVKVDGAQPAEGFQGAVRGIQRPALEPSDENGELSSRIEQHRNVEYRDQHVVKAARDRVGLGPKLGDAPRMAELRIGEEQCPQISALPRNVESGPENDLHRAAHLLELAEYQTV